VVAATGDEAVTHFYNAVIIALLLLVAYILHSEFRYIAWLARDIQPDWPKEYWHGYP
jgi:hypothetical protein